MIIGSINIMAGIITTIAQYLKIADLQCLKHHFNFVPIHLCAYTYSRNIPRMIHNALLELQTSSVLLNYISSLYTISKQKILNF